MDFACSFVKTLTRKELEEILEEEPSEVVGEYYKLNADAADWLPGFASTMPIFRIDGKSCGTGIIVNYDNTIGPDSEGQLKYRSIAGP